MKPFAFTWVWAIALIVVGCTASPSAGAPTSTLPTPSEPAPTQEAREVVEITIGVADLLGSDDATTQLQADQIALFEELHPHIKINTMEWGWQAEAFAEQLAAGEVPDVMQIAATEGQLVIDNGYAADITDLWGAWNHSDDFNEQIIATYARGEQIYGVPAVIYIMGLFYDKVLFDEAGLLDISGEAVPPTNWDEFVAAAVAVEENTGAAGFCILTQANQGGWNFMNWGWQAGGTFERQVGGQWEASFDEAPIVDALSFIQALRWEHDVLQEDLELDAATLINEKLSNHECGMALISPDWLQYIAEDGDLEDYGLANLPAGPAGSANLMGGAFDIIRADLSPEKQRAAFEWIIWYEFSVEALENDLQSEAGRNRWTFFNRSLMYQPNSPISIRERELLDKYRGIPYYRDYVEAATRYARVEPSIATQDLYAALDAVLWEVLTNENADPEALLNEAAQAFEAEYMAGP